MRRALLRTAPESSTRISWYLGIRQSHEGLHIFRELLKVERFTEDSIGPLQ